MTPSSVLPHLADAPRKRRKLSLLANIMQDLDLTDSQKTAFAVVVFLVLVLPHIWKGRSKGKPRPRFGKDLAEEQRRRRGKKDAQGGGEGGAGKSKGS